MLAEDLTICQAALPLPRLLTDTLQTVFSPKYRIMETAVCLSAGCIKSAFLQTKLQGRDTLFRRVENWPGLAWPA